MDIRNAKYGITYIDADVLRAHWDMSGAMRRWTHFCPCRYTVRRAMAASTYANDMHSGDSPDWTRERLQECAASAIDTLRAREYRERMLDERNEGGI